MTTPTIIVIDLDDEDLQDDLYQAALAGTLAPPPPPPPPAPAPSK